MRSHCWIFPFLSWNQWSRWPKESCCANPCVRVVFQICVYLSLFWILCASFLTDISSRDYRNNKNSFWLRNWLTLHVLWFWVENVNYSAHTELHVDSWKRSVIFISKKKKTTYDERMSLSSILVFTMLSILIILKISLIYPSGIIRLQTLYLSHWIDCNQ